MSDALNELDDASLFAAVQARLERRVQHHKAVSMTATRTEVISPLDWENALADSKLFDCCANMFANAAEAARSVLPLRDVFRLRSINASQPVNKLPVEVLRDIFDILAVRSDCPYLPVNLPQILAVSSYWRQVALAYSRLWATIQINLNRQSAFGVFDAGSASRDLRRLQEHLTRSRNARLSCHIEYGFEVLYSRETGVKDLVSLLYQYSDQIHALTMDILVDDDNDDDYPLNGILLPLPKPLPNLHRLDVKTHGYGFEGYNYPLLIQGSRIAPMELSISSHISLTLDMVDPSRLVDLTIKHSENTVDYDGTYDLLQRASRIRRLVMTGGFEFQTPFDVRLRILEGTIMRPPLALPTLKSLVLSHIWVHAPYIVAPATIEHLAITYERGYQDVRDEPEEPRNINAFFAGFRSLRSMQIPFVPMVGPVLEDLDVGCWLAGKEHLVALMLPYRVIQSQTASAFALSRLPSLRYLFLNNNVYWNYSSSTLLAALRAILELNRQLRIIFSEITTESPLVVTLREEGFGERLLVLDYRSHWKDGILEDITRAHDRGDNDVQGWLTRREWLHR